ncbi:hypothetical protein ACOW9W_004151 [Vibrio parahaemolyticus]
MIEKITHVKNPLTVIAMFAGIAEIGGTIVLPFIEVANQATYIWFLMLFPMLLILLFFITLNFNHKVLYAPSDYKNESHFLELFGYSNVSEQLEKIESELAEDGFKVELNETSNRISRTIAAEKLAIQDLARKLSVQFKPNVKFETPAGRQMLFDGVAFDGNTVHTLEAKLISSKATISKQRFKAILEKSAQVQEQWEAVDTRKLVFHYYLIVDTDEIDLELVREVFESVAKEYRLKSRLEVVKFSGLEV